MIIKEDKLAQAEADVEQLSETPPPYSRTPGVRVVVPLPEAHSSLSSHTRVPSTASSAPASVAGTASSSASTSQGGPERSYRLIPPPPGLQRTSFFQLRLVDKHISECIVVDPYYPHPSYSTGNVNGSSVNEEGGSDEFGPRFGSPVPGDPDRKNVRLECKNRNVNAEIWVVGGPYGDDVNDDSGDDSTGRRKAGIDVRTNDGTVRLKIHASSSSPAFALRVAALNGGVRVALPRSFIGPLTTRTRNGWATLSPGLAQCVTVFSELRGTRKSFIGDFVDSGYGRGDWSGSSLDITCENGRIKLSYVDEDVRKASSRGSGRFLG